MTVWRCFLQAPSLQVTVLVNTISHFKIDTLPHCPGRGPMFHRGASRCYWGATLVTGVHWTDHEISRGAPQPTRNAKFGRAGNLSTKI